MSYIDDVLTNSPIRNSYITDDYITPTDPSLTSVKSPIELQYINVFKGGLYSNVPVLPNIKPVFLSLNDDGTLTESEKPIKKNKNRKYTAKNRTKKLAKRKVRIKFVVGKHYILRGKSRDGSREIIREFVCKKFIYSMKENPMNIVIMKQVSGPEGKKYTLDKSGCLDYHIKWEPGLEIFAMEMFWIPKKDEKK